MSKLIEILKRVNTVLILVPIAITIENAKNFIINYLEQNNIESSIENEYIYVKQFSLKIYFKEFGQLSDAKIYDKILYLKLFETNQVNFYQSLLTLEDNKDLKTCITLNLDKKHIIYTKNPEELLSSLKNYFKNVYIYNEKLIDKFNMLNNGILLVSSKLKNNNIKDISYYHVYTSNLEDTLYNIKKIYKTANYTFCNYILTIVYYINESEYIKESKELIKYFEIYKKLLKKSNNIIEKENQIIIL